LVDSGEKTNVSFTGTVKDGVVVLPPGVELPDGLEVELTVPDAEAGPSFAERYAAYIGAADDLPADLAANLDHYVHGHRKP
jgi:hypothetical protein